MDNDDELYKNLVILFKMFKNRPNHLAKYMVDNSALSKEFINDLIRSNRLKQISDSGKDPNIPYFNNINKMNDFYDSILEDIELSSGKKNREELTKELNEKLDNCIKNEKYEDATRLRDYMTRNNIVRINKFK